MKYFSVLPKTKIYLNKKKLLIFMNRNFYEQILREFKIFY